MTSKLTRTALMAALLVAGMGGSAGAAKFVEPPVFSSKKGVLDILMIARAKPVAAIAFKPPGQATAINPTGWVYEICYRSQAINDRCPLNKSTISEFGGVRLALQPGDKLKIRLVNRLPKQDPNKVMHYWNSDEETPVVDEAGVNLPLSPTNLHTHGLVVQARGATVNNPTWGDDIYVTLYNPANGMPQEQMMDHGAVVTSGVLDYVIDIPPNEPSGADWFHPHVHGITSDSLSSGLSGIISIGRHGTYLSDGKKAFPKQQQRHLILKDMQVLAAGTVNFQQGINAYPFPVSNGEVLDDQQDPQFCTQYPASPAETRLGSCPGTNVDGDNDYTNGAWYFPVSGVVYPTIAVNKPKGELWSITNASASATYRLELNSNTGNYPMLMQLISVDGISAYLPPGTSLADKQKLGGSRFDVVTCPGTWPADFPEPMCIKSMSMLPGSRAEVWVTYRDASGNIVKPPRGASATLRSVGITTGEAGVGDPWPAVNLAAVTFHGTYTNSALVALKLEGEALKANAPQGIFAAKVPYAQAANLPPGCAALPPGHRRRIFFGLVDVTNPNIFGLGYEELDQDGKVVLGSEHPVSAFDPMNPFICLPLAAGQMPVREAWELVNLATENHNFHIHQTKFRAVDPTLAPGSKSPFAPILHPETGPGVMEDEATLQIAHAKDQSWAQEISDNQNGYCTIAQWHDGTCINTPAVVDIPFAETGEFVYHCHILEHEDAGMMAKIQVVPSPVP
ncbi:multicopper oxidase domain-containing protein [Aestuariivirga litoralis]|uniref:multicopper oxidase domain-containing protein n=1 Tax=Aestuariivirga litoralis TaxID=2650924 RepID=UPI001FE112FA|nr:multicopper oxidase domain-containing protein [Aestuariivirga litoralis]